MLANVEQHSRPNKKCLFRTWPTAAPCSPGPGARAPCTLHQPLCPRTHAASPPQLPTFPSFLEAFPPHLLRSSLDIGLRAPRTFSLGPSPPRPPHPTSSAPVLCTSLSPCAQDGPGMLLRQTFTNHANESTVVRLTSSHNTGQWEEHLIIMLLKREGTKVIGH